jgi:quercetin dioxygenase-like cupin family protein
MQTTFERPFKPVELTPATIEAFDMQALARQLRLEKPFVEHGRNGLTLARDDQLTMVLTVAKEGKMLLEPHPPGPVAIVMLSGSVTLTTEGSVQQISLGPGMSAAFSPDIVDHVEVHTESAFLIMIGGRQ